MVGCSSNKGYLVKPELFMTALLLPPPTDTHTHITDVHLTAHFSPGP